MNYGELIRRIGLDKVAHFAVSAFLCLAFGRFLPFWASALIVTALGVGKELYDAKTGGKVDKTDLIADASGIIIATLILII